jgi:hypothetical protein
MLRSDERTALAPRATARAVMSLLALASLAGCGGWSSFCTDRMDCLKGNDADIDACQVELDAEEDRATVAGCTDAWDAFASCAQDNYKCKDQVFSDNDACKKQNDAYAECMQ